MRAQKASFCQARGICFPMRKRSLSGARDVLLPGKAQNGGSASRALPPFVFSN
ncbi:MULTISPECIES: hypothetical protein [Corynebacterium]|uniref:Uncharacterized protein n=1 Tax=Corynebacterium glucuronolyticum TaxID=39791 RepID=A0AAX1LAR3_9CORY|nr:MULTISPECIES: hypothetical protein [Corynebacterium]EEI28216.1 hypothetical protein HMPREF0294_0396 [Corynebacterium glucuronolyticum ATCC 51867]MCT1563339.1 hypothetical protein [Corynebacterium glucuronolyticum]QRO81845.1 hypothetical protein I6J20_08090 [Corynebacterium glucuronolyticum]QRP70959.1 hypothetical protein I6J21_02000 [Corynebacterium glucuronolyticum]